MYALILSLGTARRGVKALHRGLWAVISLRMSQQRQYSETCLLRAGSRLLLSALTIFSFAYCSLEAVAEPRSASISELRAQLDRILTTNDSTKVRLGARVVEMDSGLILYDRNGKAPLIPASNMKLVVMAAAIEGLGHDFKYETVLAIRDTDLVVIGSGDPTIGDERLAASRDERITAVFAEWAEALKSAGVRQIPGNIVVDDLVFDLHFTHPKWPPNQYQKWYEAGVGGLNFNANCVQAEVIPTRAEAPAKIRLIPRNDLITVKNRTITGSKNSAVVSRLRNTNTLVVSGKVAKRGKLQEVTVSDPGLFFGHVLKAVLEDAGLRIGGKVVREKVSLSDGVLPMDCHVVAVHRSPLADTLSRCGKNSLGMMAEALFKKLGSLQAESGSWESGRSALHGFLRRAGVPADEVTVSDGSGLSRYNRLSAGAATQLLRHAFRGPDGEFELLRESLSIAGTDGTLRKRLRQEDVRGRIFAKTGTINGVRTLAGYIHTHSDDWLTFAFFYNFSGRKPSPKQRMDRACRLLVHWPDVPTDKAAKKSKSQ